MGDRLMVLLLEKEHQDYSLVKESLDKVSNGTAEVVACNSLQEVADQAASRPFGLAVAPVDLLEEEQLQEKGLPGFFQETYFLALLSSPGVEQVERALSLGADDFIIYPITSDELAARLSRAVKGVRRNRKHVRYDLPSGHATVDLARESEVQYRNVVERANDGIVIAQDGLLKYVNPVIALITGYQAEEITGTPLANYLHPSEVERVAERYRRRIAGEEVPSRYETIIKHKDGSDIYVEFNAGLTIYQGRPADMVIIRDITERKKVEEALRRSEERYREILDQIQEGYYEVDLEGNITFCNEAACRLLGYSQEEFVGLNFRNLYRDPDQVFQVFHQVFSTGESNRGFALEMIGKDGRTRYGELSVSLIKDARGKVIGFRGVGRDVTERKQSEEKIRYLSFYDKLTGLYNRAFFEEEIRRLDTERQLPLSIIIGDANGLKLVNDAFGHQEGDSLLKRIAGILQSCCRREDIICRWGGDEFAVLLPKTPPESVKGLIRRIQQTCEEAVPEPIQLSIALGMATKNAPSQDIFNIVKKAETEMYGHKLQEAKNFRNSVIASLVKKLGEKDYETEEHSWRMQNMAVELGLEMELNENVMDELILAVTLHDIGKIAVPDYILMKPERLTPEEWELVKEHSERGYRIAMTSAELARIAPVILAHHERWDGKGYPQGLKGEEIPLLSRLVAVIDAYDVMTCGRPYKKPLSPQEALAELERCAGSQFDPSIVEAFLKLNGSYKFS